MKPSPAELIILKSLWLNSAQSAREIHQSVEVDLDWSYSSTRKTLERMQAKRMISASESHGLKIYRARLKKIPTLAGMIRHFASEVLGLEGPLPVASLSRSHLLNPEELQALDALLRDPDTSNDKADSE